MHPVEAPAPRSMPRPIPTLSCIALCAAMLCPALTQAQARVSLAEVRGRGSAALRSTLQRALNDRRDVENVEDAESSTLLLEGRVRRARRRWVARVSVRTVDGRQVDELTVRGRTLVQLRRRARAAVGVLAFPAPEPAADDASNTDSPIRVAVRPVDGPGRASVRRALRDALTSEDGIQIVPDREVERMARELGVSADEREGRVQIGAKLEIHVWLEAWVDRPSRVTFELTVDLFDGATGEAMEQATFEGRSIRALAAAATNGLWPYLGDALLAARPPVDPVDAGSGEAEHVLEPREPPEVAGSSPRRRSALSAHVGVRIVNRSFDYADDLFHRLSDYSLAAAPAVVVGGTWYPTAHFDLMDAVDFGFSGGAETLFLVESQTEGGQLAHPTDMRSWFAGVRARFLVGENQITGGLDYSRHSFRIEPGDPILREPRVPDVRYGMVRASIGARVPVDLVTLELGLGYATLLSLGAIGTEAWYPRASGGGLFAEGTVVFAISHGFELRAGVDLRRYFLSMHPEPGDTNVAGGAVDQYISATLGLGWVWPEG